MKITEEVLKSLRFEKNLDGDWVWKENGHVFCIRPDQRDDQGNQYWYFTVDKKDLGYQAKDVEELLLFASHAAFKAGQSDAKATIRAALGVV